MLKKKKAGHKSLGTSLKVKGGLAGSDLKIENNKEAMKEKVQTAK